MRIIKSISFDNDEINLIGSVMPSMISIKPDIAIRIQHVLDILYIKGPLGTSDIQFLFSALSEFIRYLDNNKVKERIDISILDSISAEDNVMIPTKHINSVINAGRNTVIDNINSICHTITDILNIAMSHSTQAHSNNISCKSKKLNRKNITILDPNPVKLELMRYSCSCIGFKPHTHYDKLYSAMIELCRADGELYRKKHGKPHVALSVIPVEDISYIPIGDIESDYYYNKILGMMNKMDKQNNFFKDLKEVISGI